MLRNLYLMLCYFYEDLTFKCDRKTQKNMFLIRNNLFLEEKNIKFFIRKLILNKTICDILP